jgi:hypothetical protein
MRALRAYLRLPIVVSVQQLFARGETPKRVRSHLGLDAHSGQIVMKWCMPLRCKLPGAADDHLRGGISPRNRGPASSACPPRSIDRSHKTWARPRLAASLMHVDRGGHGFHAGSHGPALIRCNQITHSSAVASGALPLQIKGAARQNQRLYRRLPPKPDDMGCHAVGTHAVVITSEKREKGGRRTVAQGSYQQSHSDWFWREQRSLIGPGRQSARAQAYSVLARRGACASSSAGS